MNEVPPALIRISEVALKQSPAQIDPISLAMILYSLMKICSKAFLRKTFLRAEKKPHGIVARIIKSKIKAKMPEGLKTDLIINPILQAAYFAAHDEFLWNGLYDLKDEIKWS